MIWLSWRQFRTQALAASLAVAAAVAVLALTGPRIASLSRTNHSVFDALTGADRALFYAGVLVIAVAPAVVGAFWGAPLVAREIETGTHRLAWQQSVTRTRWLATKLMLTGLISAATAGALSAVVMWWADPIDGAVSSGHGAFPARLTPVTFAMRGVVPVGYAVFALMLGVAAGLLLGRTIPAMVLTIAVFVAVQIAVPLWVRPHLIPPTQASLAFTSSTLQGVSSDGPGRPVTVTLHTPDRGDWILTRVTTGADGRPATVPGWFSECLPDPAGAPAGRTVARPIDECLDQLTTAGYRQHLSYQRADRFWPMQWAETALFLVMAALLAAVDFALLRRRG